MPVAHVVAVLAKVLAFVGFVALIVLVMRFCFPRSAARIDGTTAVYPGGMTSRMLTGSYGTARLVLAADCAVIRGRGPFGI